MMAGHRRRDGDPRRSPGRRSADRVTAASTPKERLDAAFDVFRVALVRLDRRDPVQAASVAAGAADYLIGLATRMEGAS